MHRPKKIPPKKSQKEIEKISPKFVKTFAYIILTVMAFLFGSVIIAAIFN